MKAREILNSFIQKYGPVPEDTIDTCKAGDPEKEVAKIAVGCIASVDVIKTAAKWGADLLITHEPTYYDHFDNVNENEVLTTLKQKLIEETGLCIWRYHDSPHVANPDIINLGFIQSLGWKGEFKGETGFILNTPQSAASLAADIEAKLHIPHVGIVGAIDKPISRLSLSTGQRILDEVLRDDWYELIIAGEIIEWKYGEYVRDAALMGMNKAMLVLGHIASEREGMKYVANLLTNDFPSLRIKYIDSDVIYRYNVNN